MLKNKQIGFIGGGAMAEAIISGILNNKLALSDQILVSDLSHSRLEYLKNKYSIVTSLNNQDIAQAADILFLSVKPQVITKALQPITSAISKDSLVVSIAAGVSIRTLQKMLPDIRIVRVMPNTPMTVGEGMAAICLGSNASQEDGAIISDIFSTCGKSLIVDENYMDAVTGLSGSGPGFGFVIIDALADAGVRVGLARQTALTLAAQTLLGTAKMVLETGQHPAQLRDMVTSPNGTTIAGIHALEEKGIRAALIDGVIAATNRSAEMGKSVDE